MRLRWRFPACFTAAVLLVVVGNDLWAAPRHEVAGGTFTAWWGAIDRLAELPGLILAQAGGQRFHAAGDLAERAIVLAVCGVVYFVFGFMLQWVWGRRRSRGTGSATNAADESAASVSALSSASNSQAVPSAATSPKPAGAPWLITRRTVLTGAVAGAAYACLGQLRAVEVTRHRFAIRGLPAPLAGLRVVHLTDLHHGPWMPIDFIRRVVDDTNALNPDLVVLTGDYVLDSPKFIQPIVDELRRLRGRVGVVATLGNHDWWEGGVQCMRAFEAAGIPLIDNNRVFVTGDRTLSRTIGLADRRHALCVAGFGDLWEGEPNYRSALHDLPEAMPRLVLSHNPDSAEHDRLLRWSPRIDLMLSGHTHGGQVSVPGYGPPVTLSRYGQKYASGLVQGPICPVYVSRGIGTTVAPIRFGVRPEMAVFELASA
jgi:predicted MPP superfamily phosphohydrolase